MSFSVWIGNVFPIARSRLDPRFWLIKRIELRSGDYIPLELQSLIVNSQPSWKEGGILYKFNLNGDTQVLEKINSHIQKNRLHSFYKINAIGIGNYSKLQVLKVHGSPWIDDLVSCKVSRRLKVEIFGQVPSREEIYQEFRKYGKLLNIKILDQVKDKDSRIVFIDFSNLLNAVSAKICSHGSRMGNSRLDVGYDPFIHDFWFWNWITSHPRIVLPIILALLGILSLVIFDPIRIYSIEAEIKDEFRVKKIYHYILSWFSFGVDKLKNSLWDSKNKSRNLSNLKSLEQLQALEKLELNLHGTPENIILVHGPPGSGKSDLVSAAVRSRLYTLGINCKSILSEHASKQISCLASQLNYFPSFSELGLISKMIDSLIGIATGTKITPVDQLASFNSSSEKEYRQILDCLTLALSNIVYKQKSKTTRDNVDEKVEYPVIVIDGYLNSIGNLPTGSNAHVIFKVLEEWAAFVIEQKIAHIVFISDQPSANKSLLKALETRPLDLYTLSDSSRESAIAYMKEDLAQFPFTDKDYEKCIDLVGGRLTDLQQLITKLKTGRDLQDCLDDVRGRAINELSKIGLSKSKEKDMPWTAIQFWKIVQLLSKYEQVDFDNVRYHTLFKGDGSSILAMERSGIVSITRNQGKEQFIRAGRPILQNAFKDMTSDQKLISTLGIETTNSYIESETKKLKVLEEELQQLTNSYTILDIC